MGGLTDVVRSPEFATVVGLLLFGLENLSHQDRMRMLNLTPEKDFSDVVMEWSAKVKGFFSGALSS